MEQSEKNELEKELTQLKKGAFKIMKEVGNLEKKLNNNSKDYSLNKDENIDLSITDYLYSAMEMQQDREQEKIENIMKLHEEEKDKMRKWFGGIVLTLIIGFCSLVIWFFSNYEFATYTQSGDGLNNIANKTTQGDVTYESETEDYPTEESKQG